MLTVELGNVLDANAEAIIVNVDGAHERMLGNIAHQLKGRIDDEAWEDLMDQVNFPIPLGRCVSAELEDDNVSFKHVIFASCLGHRNLYGGSNHMRYMHSALMDARMCALTIGVKSVAMAMATGGWRIGSRDAVNIVSNFPKKSGIEFKLRFIHESDYNDIVKPWLTRNCA